MPEGDTVLSAANNLHQILVDKTLVRGDLNWPSAPVHGIAGRKIVEVDAYAKHMLMRLDDGRTLRTHLRMDGAWRIVRPDSREAQRVSGMVRCVLATNEWVALGYRLGMLDVFPTDTEAQELSHMGPDILADNFVPTPLLNAAANDPTLRLAPRYASGQLHRSSRALDSVRHQAKQLGSIEQDTVPVPLRGPRVSDFGWRDALARFAEQDPHRFIGEVLLDQSVVSGIGTIHMAEGLFKTQESPWLPVAQVDVQRLIATIRASMVRACQDYPRSRRIHVHSRDHQPCHRCGAQLEVGAVGKESAQRPAFYCAHCQSVTTQPPLWRPRG